MEYRDIERLVGIWRELEPGDYAIVSADVNEGLYVAEMVQDALRGSGLDWYTIGGWRIEPEWIECRGVRVLFITPERMDIVRGRRLRGWVAHGRVMVDEDMVQFLDSRMR